MKFIHDILGGRGIINVGRISAKAYLKDAEFGISKWCIETKKQNKNPRLERTLFEFSNQLGAFLLHIFLQTMDSEYIIRLLRFTRVRENEYGEEKNRLAEWWIRNAILPRLICMLWKFRESLESFGYIRDILSKEGRKHREKLGYSLKKKESNPPAPKIS